MTRLSEEVWKKNYEVLLPWIGTTITYAQLCKIFDIAARQSFLGANSVGDSKLAQLIQLGLVRKIEGHPDEDDEEQFIPSSYLITGGNPYREKRIKWLDELLA